MFLFLFNYGLRFRGVITPSGSHKAAIEGPLIDCETADRLSCHLHVEPTSHRRRSHTRLARRNSAEIVPNRILDRPLNQRNLLFNDHHGGLSCCLMCSSIRFNNVPSPVWPEIPISTRQIGPFLMGSDQSVLGGTRGFHRVSSVGNALGQGH